MIYANRGRERRVLHARPHWEDAQCVATCGPSVLCSPGLWPRRDCCAKTVLAGELNRCWSAASGCAQFGETRRCVCSNRSSVIGMIFKAEGEEIRDKKKSAAARLPNNKHTEGSGRKWGRAQALARTRRGGTPHTRFVCLISLVAQLAHQLAIRTGADSGAIPSTVPLFQEPPRGGSSRETAAWPRRPQLNFHHSLPSWRWLTRRRLRRSSVTPLSKYNLQDVAQEAWPELESPGLELLQSGQTSVWPALGQADTDVES